ncbi:hypothetical protein CYLTODRAFT_403633 [Cylindrobasidium torrendii FP15055 ss-10]|uniref:Uncharacterized protein n=1 Tax=Cylindrobasidium torrendii FP15055 ss-10 TaxID=1314674 RepID=A0A0D7AZ18_9AGAR|nr:hypothetical protein CYLTODRAFT_403633 [Cylindrobasidium torrendii FP15055 ss-10]
MSVFTFHIETTHETPSSNPPSLNQPSTVCPPERGRVSDGSRELYCAQCASWVRVGADPTLRNLGAHQTGLECRAAAFDRITSYNNANTYPSLPAATYAMAGLQPGTSSHLESSSSSSVIQHPSPPIPCSGAWWRWPIPRPHRSYPQACHDPDSRPRAGYQFVTISMQHIIVRGNTCNGWSYNGTPICTACMGTEDLFKKVAKRAAEPFKGHFNDGLSHDQLVEKVRHLESELHDAGLDPLDPKRTAHRAEELLEAFEQLLDLLGTHDVPGLNRIFRIAKEAGWGIETLLEKCRLALSGRYHPESFERWEIQLAIALYEIGGGAALHLLHMSPFRFPSRDTIAPHRREHDLRITSGGSSDFEKFADVFANILSLFSDTSGSLRKVVMTLAMDEISIDARLCWLATNDSIVGLCEHVKDHIESLKMGSTLETVKLVAGLVREGKVHVGQELFVASVSRNDEFDYGTRPVLIIPTCKKDSSYTTAAHDIEVIKQAWKLCPSGEALHGSIGLIASDGDPKRRVAIALHAMVSEITADHSWYPYFGGLVGVNQWIGQHGEIQDMDFKHNMKRICKLLSTSDGIVINGIVVNRSIVSSWLGRNKATDWTHDSIYDLLNPDTDFEILPQTVNFLLSPKDLQDVPRAIKLLRVTADLRHMSTVGMTAAQLDVHSALCLLAELLDALVEPFANPAMSLSEQITSLSQFSFILAALYSDHGNSFIPHPLYFDLQSMVKAAYARVVQTKLLNPEYNVFLCLLGDDVLETLFGRARMLGGHNPNGDVGEFRRRFCSSIRLDGIFRKWPHWEQISERLAIKMHRAADADHIVPRVCTGELRASSCDLSLCHHNGMRRAEAILSAGRVTHWTNFTSHFANGHSRGVDLFRPKGGKYPGLSTASDRSLEDVADGLTDHELSADPHTFERYGISFDGKTAFTQLQASGLSHSSVQDATLAVSPWIVFDDGRRVHKKTVLRIFLDNSLDTDYQKSHDRLLRVRYFSIGGDSPERARQATYSVKAADLLRLNDLYGTLVAIDETRVSLAIAQCTSISVGNDLYEFAPRTEITMPHSRFELTGQILSLLAVGNGSGDTMWVWDGSYVALNPPAIGSKRTLPTTARLEHLQISVNGELTYPFHPEMVHSVSPVTLPHSNLLLDQPKMSKLTYTIGEATLQLVLEDLRRRVLTASGLDGPRGKIPVYGQILQPYKTTGPNIQVHFPYRKDIYSGNGTWLGVEHILSDVIPPAPKNAPIPCAACNTSIAGPFRQTHMGKHLLRLLHGIDDGYGNALSTLYPCGFCGQSMLNGACELEDRRGIVHCKCPLEYKFRIKDAAKMSTKKPSTNVPIKCFCDEVHWKYNMGRHLDENHQGWQLSLDAARRRELEEKIQITEEEFEAIGVPVGSPWVYVEDVYDARHTGHIPSIHDGHGDSPHAQRTVHYPPYTGIALQFDS